MDFLKKRASQAFKNLVSQKFKKVIKKTFEKRAPYLGYLYVRIYVVISNLR